jgi:hypothetical protein
MTSRERLRSGLVMPAHPLALTSERKLDERRQRALTRYYCVQGLRRRGWRAHHTICNSPGRIIKTYA